MEKTNVFDILNERGYIEQMTHPDEIKELFGKESVPFYIGIDPTADSLHVGHFVSLMVASHMQKCGHKPIILVGGGTATIGDPSGKTEKGALWLDPTKTSPYEFYQYWRNIEDDSVETVLKLLTFLPMEKINKLSSLKDEKINEAKKIAAFEITKLVHGEEEAIKAQEAANALFSGSGSLDNMPTVELGDNKFISIIDAIIVTKIAPSKGQARTLIAQGGISVNDTKITDVNYVLSADDFKDGYAILKKGKKVFYKLV